MQLKASLSLHCAPNQGYLFLAHVAVIEVAPGQCAIDAQRVGDRSDALGGVSASAPGHTAELVVGEVDARQPAIDTHGVGDRSDTLCSVCSPPGTIDAAQLIV